MCEPFALLCWALILHRMGKDGDYILARTMLSNIYLIPHLLGKDIEKADMWHSSSDEYPDYINYLPERIHDAITGDDLVWMREKYYSFTFQKVLLRHIEIKKELESTPVGDRRSALVNELYNLLDGWC